MYRSVLILINYLPAIDDIQRYHRSRVIDNALQEPVYGNPWIIRPAIFIIGETIRSSSLLHTAFESLHETLVYQIQVRWQINILMISSPYDSPILMVDLTTSPGMHTSFGRWSSIDLTGTVSNMLRTTPVFHLSLVYPSHIFFVSQHIVPHNQKSFTYIDSPY